VQALPAAGTLTGKARGRKHDADIGTAWPYRTRRHCAGIGGARAGDGLVRGWWSQRARRMSRRNSRQGKARRRTERDRRQVTERAREEPREPGPGPAGRRGSGGFAARRPDPRDSEEPGSKLRSDAGSGLIAVDPARRVWVLTRIWGTRIPATSAILTPTTPTCRPCWRGGPRRYRPRRYRDLAVTSTYRKDRTDPGTRGLPACPAVRRGRGPGGAGARVARPSGDGVGVGVGAGEGERSSSSVMMTTIFRPRRSRWRAPRRTRSRTT